MDTIPSIEHSFPQIPKPFISLAIPTFVRSATTLLFFFNDTATTEIYTLSLHDALPIYVRRAGRPRYAAGPRSRRPDAPFQDRKSTRLNSSHQIISYAVFCLKKKKENKAERDPPQHKGPKYK